jgi:hypothetical protein
MPYIAHVPGTPWTNPFNGYTFNSEQSYLHGMMCESSEDMNNWRNFQRLHGLAVTPFGELHGCVLTGLTGQARINKCASLGAIQFHILNPNKSTMKFKKHKKNKITSKQS